MVDNRHDWLRSLEASSKTIANLNLRASLPIEHYRDPSSGVVTNPAAYNLSASPEHNQAIAHWVDALAVSAATSTQLRKQLTDLTSSNTYGTFSELAAYGAFFDHGLRLDIQVAMPGTSILNPNGSDLDGCLHLNNEVLFDVKAFGAQEYLVSTILQRLRHDLAPDNVFAEGSWDVPVSILEGLLGGRNYSQLKADILAHPRVQRHSIEFCRHAPKAVQISRRLGDPYALAEQNADYAFKFAKQFPRRKPFLLVFVYHPWTGGLNNHVNFVGTTDTYMRALARRTFLQFQRDRKMKYFGITRAAASRLLSGLLFINAWMDGSGWKDMRLYLNPLAKTALTDLDVDLLKNEIRWLLVDDFKYDTY